jgi:hypothetical protein
MAADFRHLLSLKALAHLTFPMPRPDPIWRLGELELFENLEA